MKKRIIITTILCSGLLLGNKAEVHTFAQEIESKNNIQEVRSLTLNEALNILVKNNPNIDYLYQGDETSFEYLQNLNLKGYVFLPDVDTDLGYFIDKDSNEVYNFHPSGYLELIK